MPIRRLRSAPFVFPTGEVLPAGASELRVHMLGMWNTLAIGVGHRVEIHLSAPVVPMVASAGVRVGLLGPGSPVKLAVGVAGWVPALSHGSGYVVSGTVTAAYAGDRFNLHATAGTALASSFRESARLYDVGASLRVSAGVALLADAAHLWLPITQCSDCEGVMELDALVAGVKVLGDRFDTDLGVALQPPYPGWIPVPLVSATAHF